MLSELGRILVYWLSVLRADALAILAASGVELQHEFEAHEWIISLSDDWFSREKVALILQEVMWLLVGELTMLAVAERIDDAQFQALKLTIEWKQSESEHKLQGLCSLFGFELTADRVRSFARELWSADTEIDGHSLRDDILKAVKLWPAWQNSKDALQHHLAVLVEQHPFPGKCSDCPSRLHTKR